MDKHEKTIEMWTDYETWHVCLWMTEDPEGFERWLGRARHLLGTGSTPEEIDAATERFADEIRFAISSGCELERTSLKADLLNVALKKVDWFGIARPYVAAAASKKRRIRFPLGQSVATPGALADIPGDVRVAALARHARMDWGDVDAEARAENELSLREGFRLLSVYHTPTGVEFWIITEADRSATTILLPSEY